ncbi:ATP synthase F(0) complex subunit C2 [Nibea albiflora]|uniref:ATP synthase F(0) complex subunit C2 n=1 Tax=Nibea albiflora TaxID=240163 RepID=A0ACB7EF61_NIBAL|nr:ATP synthase F(0) complex subunit C2 [Nibea albiflora]
MHLRLAHLPYPGTWAAAATTPALATGQSDIKVFRESRQFLTRACAIIRAIMASECSADSSRGHPFLPPDTDGKGERKKKARVVVEEEVQAEAAAALAEGGKNPSLKQQLFSYAILGFALSEAMGLFCLMVAFLILFAM